MKDHQFVLKQRLRELRKRRALFRTGGRGPRGATLSQRIQELFPDDAQARFDLQALEREIRRVSEQVAVCGRIAAGDGA